MTILRLEALGRLLHAAPPQAGPTRILAIDGRGGSGKSTLARRVAAVLEAPVLHMDDLYPGWDGLAAAAPLLRRWVVEPLTRGEPGRFHRYDWERDTYGDWVDLPASDSLVVEGCGCGSRIVAPFLSLLLWVDAPLSVRFDRGIHRDGAAFRPHWERWARQEDELFAAEHTRERADYRIDGAPLQPHDPEHEVVLVP